MRSLLFEEHQRFRDNPWIWPLIALILVATLVPLGMGVYQQLVLGEPWGNQPMSDDGLIILFIFVTLCCSLSVFSLISLKLETKIDEEGIHYRMLPLRWKWVLIRPDNIIEINYERRYKFRDGAGVGFKRSVLRKMKSYRIAGGKHVEIHTAGGHRLLLGTQNLEGFEWAMKKLSTKKN